jgi:hypothetical protein
MGWARAGTTLSTAAWAGVILFTMSAGLPAFGALANGAAAPPTPTTVSHFVPSQPHPPAIAPATATSAGRSPSPGPSPALAPAGPAARPSASPTSSDIVETPPVAIPNTSPTTYVIAANMSCPKGPSPVGCSPYLNVSAPAGPWDLILLNYTGSSVPQLYDSSFHATVDGVVVLFGTTPELYSWTVLKNITEYSALFNRTATVQFSLGDAVISGYFVISVSISFYPVPDGGTPPRTPSEVVPLWHFTGVRDTQPIASVNATVPNDVENATLELYSYGFSGGTDLEEFWYTLDPAYRAVNITVDGVPLACVQPFEYINTGGLNLYFWDPVTGAYTLNDVPYQIDVTAALGLIRGTHTYNASLLGLGHGGDWAVGGSLLLYTNPAVETANLVSDPAPLVASTSGGSGIHAYAAVTDDYSFASTLVYATGPVQVESWTNETFSMAQSATGQTSTAAAGSTDVVRALTTFQQRTVSGSGTDYLNATSAPAFDNNENSTFVQTSSSGGNTYGNATDIFHKLQQNWNLTRTDTWAPRGLPKVVRATYANDNLTANGSVSDYEEFTGGGGADELALYYSFANTTKIYRSLVVDGPQAAWYNHTIASQLTTADANTGQGKVVENVVTYREASSLNESTNATDAGQPAVFAASTLGYGAPFTFDWSGLPAGCPVQTTTPVISCRSAAPDSYTVTVTPVSIGGVRGASSSVTWQNLPDPTVNLTLAAPAVDVGRTTSFSITVAASAGPVTCDWTADGVAIGPGTMCPKSVSYEPFASGTVTVEVVVTDGLGFSVNASRNLTVAGGPSVFLKFLTPPSAAIPDLAPGTSITLTCSASGGLPPFEYTWLQNGSTIYGANNESNYTFARSDGGYYNITVRVTDSEGLTALSGPLEIEVQSNRSGTNPGGGGGSTSSSGNGLSGPEAALIGVGIVGAVIIVALVALSARRRGPPPPPSDVA